MFCTFNTHVNLCPPHKMISFLSFMFMWSLPARLAAGCECEDGWHVYFASSGYAVESKFRQVMERNVDYRAGISN